MVSGIWVLGIPLGQLHIFCVIRLLGKTYRAIDFIQRPGSAHGKKDEKGNPEERSVDITISVKVSVAVFTVGTHVLAAADPTPPGFLESPAMIVQASHSPKKTASWASAPRTRALEPRISSADRLLTI